ncbi:MAG TPA: hypothetical protein VLA92_01305 [Candidatus Saccharimonadales bacterium]|nr:hypothetical protein [Candidatus Saccharimonadales bacterium]
MSELGLTGPYFREQDAAMDAYVGHNAGEEELGDYCFRRVAHIAALTEAETIFDFESAPQDAVVTITAQTTPGQSGVSELNFWKHASYLSGLEDVQWLKIPEEGSSAPLAPVVFVGAQNEHMTIAARGELKQGMGLSYYEPLALRSGVDGTQLGFNEELPPPEQLDVHFLWTLMEAKAVVLGGNNHYYWRLPGAIYQTGHVIDCRWHVQGDRYFLK